MEQNTEQKVSVFKDSENGVLWQTQLIFWTLPMLSMQFNPQRFAEWIYIRRQIYRRQANPVMMDPSIWMVEYIFSNRPTAEGSPSPLYT